MKKISLLILLVLGTGGVWSFGQMGGGMGYMGYGMDENVVFPHLAVGSGYTTAIFLMNPGQSTQPVDGTLYFFDQTGGPLTLNDGTQTADHFAVQLAPGTSWYKEYTSTTPGLTAGWAFFDVTSTSGGGMGGMMDDPHNHVFGTVIFTHTTGGAMDAQVGVMGSRYEMGYYMGMAVPVLAGGNLNTGVAVVNTWSAAGTVNLVLRDSAGNLVQETSRTLNAGAQMAQFVTEIFPGVDFTNFHGTLEVRTSSEGMVTAGLMTAGPVLTSIPCAHIPDAMPTSGDWMM